MLTKKLYFFILLFMISVIFSGILYFRIHSNGTVADTYHDTELSALTVIIDPGHGGADGGAVSLSGINESEINLEIATKLEQIMALYGINVVMTRDSQEINYPKDANTISEKKIFDQKNRLQRINDTKNAVLISIHQNNFTSSSPFGAQVLFAKTDGSEDFAKLMQQLLISTLNPENYRVATEISDNIYLMNHINCPAILIECGFLSNENEDYLLQTDSYRMKIAATIASGYLNSVDTLKEIYLGGTNEN